MVAGILNKHDKSKGSKFKNNKGTCDNVILQAKLKIKISEGSVIANNKENILSLPTISRMKLSDNYGIDMFKGETIWTDSHLKCEEQNFNVLYDEPVTLISTNNDNAVTQTYLVESDKIVFVLKKKSKPHLPAKYLLF